MHRFVIQEVVSFLIFSRSNVTSSVISSTSLLFYIYVLEITPLFASYYYSYFSSFFYSLHHAQQNSEYLLNLQ